MKLLKLLKPNQICLELKATSKQEVLEEMLKSFIALGIVPAEMFEEVLNALVERESLTSTGLGYGMAVPHVKTNAVSQICIVFARSSKGLEFDALDGNVVHLFFMVLAPVKVTDDYLKTLSKISALMKDEKIRKRLLAAGTAEEIVSILG